MDRFLNVQNADGRGFMVWLTNARVEEELKALADEAGWDADYMPPLHRLPEITVTEAVKVLTA